jgi:predicted KAP-like P-loop ATPase
MEAELHLLKRGKAFFGFYETMLGESSRVSWSRIVDTQVGVMSWADLQGTVHNEEREHSAQAFRDCVKFHLLSVFTYDAAEHQKYYISHHRKKSRKILLRYFCNRIKMLNRYIPNLPGLVDSPQGANMKRAEALTEP